jgi:superfamily II DNA helicase RecQ
MHSVAQPSFFNVCSRFGVGEMMPQQKQVLNYLLAKNDVLAILPTGFGKSLIYQMFPLMLETC